MTWVQRLRQYLPITAISQEIVRFDMQKMQNPEISGVEYQQGTLFGYEVREYLLDKWRRQCGYCGAKDKRLEVDHIVPRSHGGSDRVSRGARKHETRESPPPTAGSNSTPIPAWSASFFAIDRPTPAPGIALSRA